MKTLPVWTLAALMLVGCLSLDRSEGDFRPVHSLQRLAGAYRNEGRPANGSARPARLSQLLWPEDATLAHVDVVEVQVQAPTDRSLEVRAVDRFGHILKVGAYEQGRDFEFNGLTLRLALREGLVGFKGGEPMLGKSKGQVELGLDLDGQGKARSTESAVGLVYGVIPLSLGASLDLRFEKIR